MKEPCRRVSVGVREICRCSLLALAMKGWSAQEKQYHQPKEAGEAKGKPRKNGACKGRLGPNETRFELWTLEL